MGPTYDRLGYKRMILDLHYGTYRSDALVHVRIDEIVDLMAKAGVDSLLHFTRDHWGYIYTNGKIGRPHPNTPDDLFGKLLVALKSRGIRTTGYLSVHYDENTAREYPEWVMRNPQGEPIKRAVWSEGQVRAGWTYLCLNSPYREYLLAHSQEVIASYDIAAFWVDIIGGADRPPRGEACYCTYCRRLWQSTYGYPLPESMTPAQYALWRQFYTAIQIDFYAEIKEIIRASGKDIVTTRNFGFPFDLDDYVESESSHGGVDYYLPSRLTKLYRAYAHGREVECVGYRFNQPWDFTTKPLPSLQFEVATALAHNCAITFVDQPQLRGELDPKPYDSLAQAFALADELIPHVRGSEPYAELALVGSELSGDLLPKTETDFAGAYCMLTEAHLPFDVLADSLIATSDLAQYRAIVVANTVHMQPEAASALRRYVYGGGVLLFSNRSATLTFDAQPLAEPSFGFLRIIGDCPYVVSFARPTIPSHDTRLRVQDTVWFRPHDDAKTMATFTPPALEVMPDKWMSHNVMPGLDGTRPASVVGSYGQGRYIYIAPRIFAEYVLQGLPSIREFVLNLLEPHYRPLIWLEAPRAVEAVYQRQGRDLVVVLINGLTDKPRAGGNLRHPADRGYIGITEIVPIANLRLHLPARAHMTATQADGKPLAVLATPGECIVEIPRLDLCQIVRLPLFDSR